MVQDAPDMTVEDSKCYPVPPGVNRGAYIESSTSLTTTVAPLVPIDNYSASSDASVLGSPMDIQHNATIVHSERTTGFGFDRDTTTSSLGEPHSQFPYNVAFSHLSCPRYAPPPADNISNEQSNSLLSTEPVSVTSPGSISPLPPGSPGLNDCSMEYSHDDPVLPSPLPSSPVPSSSPPNFFTSSPAPNSLEKTPPTSPAPIGKVAAVSSMIYTNPLKRSRSPHTAVASTDNQDNLGEKPVKKKARHAHHTRVYCTHAVSRS